MTDIEKVLEEAKAGVLPFESWERLTGESAAAYEAFCAYRDYGTGRSIRKAAEASCAGLESKVAASLAGKVYRGWRQWSMRFQWLKRAEDYDRYLDKLKQAEIRKTIEKRGEAHREVTEKMLLVVNKKLDLMEPGELTQGAVVDWVETAIRAEREVLGVAAFKSKDGAGPGGITFTPEFEGL